MLRQIGWPTQPSSPHLLFLDMFPWSWSASPCSCCPGSESLDPFPSWHPPLPCSPNCWEHPDEPSGILDLSSLDDSWMQLLFQYDSLLNLQTAAPAELDREQRKPSPIPKKQPTASTAARLLANAVKVDAKTSQIEATQLFLWSWTTPGFTFVAVLWRSGIRKNWCSPPKNHLESIPSNGKWGNMKNVLPGPLRINLVHHGDKNNWVRGVSSVIIMNLRDNAAVHCPHHCHLAEC